MKKSTPLLWLLGSFAAIFLIVGGVIAVIALIFLGPKAELQCPKDGLWYCEDLQIQLCFQTDQVRHNPDGTINTRCYALTEGSPSMCVMRSPSKENPSSLRIVKDFDISSETIFEGKVVSLDEKEYVVRREDGVVFTFRRVEEFSLEEKWKDYRVQIKEYTGVQTAGETPHIALAIQEAKALWETELGVDTTNAEISAAFDITSDCWLVFADTAGTPVALIKTNGDVIGVFKTVDDCCNDARTTQHSDGTENSFALDSEYASRYLDASSNYEKCEVNIQFSQKWKQEAEFYLEMLCEMADEDFKQTLLAAQAAWESAYQMRMDEHLAYLYYVYDSGTIVPILHSKYGYDLQRERAIELYEMYNSVKGVWEITQQHGPLPADRCKGDDSTIFSAANPIGAD